MPPTFGWSLDEAVAIVDEVAAGDYTRSCRASQSDAATVIAPVATTEPAIASHVPSESNELRYDHIVLPTGRPAMTATDSVKISLVIVSLVLRWLLHLSRPLQSLWISHANTTPSPSLCPVSRQAHTTSNWPHGIGTTGYLHGAFCRSCDPRLRDVGCERKLASVVYPATWFLNGHRRR